jgi:hypothetical protein
MLTLTNPPIFKKDQSKKPFRLSSRIDILSLVVIELTL